MHADQLGVLFAGSAAPAAAARLAAILAQMSHLMCVQGKAIAAVGLLDAQFAQHDGIMSRSKDLSDAYDDAMRLSASEKPTQATARSPLTIQWSRPKDEL